MKKILLILIILSGFTSCSDEKEESIKKYYSTGVVLSGSIDISNTFIGYIEGEKMIDLSTKVGGRITDFYVKEGDYVNKGELLLKLDSTEAKVGYSTAESIIGSLISMKNSTSEMFDRQIEAMKYKVKQVEAGKEGISKGLNDTLSITNAQLKTAKTGVETATANLNHTKVVLETKENHIYDNLESAIVGSIILDTNIINYIDQLLGITAENRKKNDSFDNYLSVKDISYLNDSKTQFLKVNNLYLDYKEFYDTKIDLKNPTKEEILLGLNKGEKLAKELKALLSITHSILDNSIESIYFTLDTINNHKSKVSNFGNNIESSLLTISGEYILGLKGSRQGLEDFEKSSVMQLDLLEKQLLLAKNNLSQYQVIAEGQINEVSTKGKVSSNQLDEINSGLLALVKQKETKLNEIQTKINEAKGQKNSAGVMINNGKIISPISGIITSKKGEIGQVIGGGMSMLSISNEDNLELNITISEELSKSIQLNDEVILLIEGSSKQNKGKIINILPSKDLITKKVGVKIILKNTLNKIKIGSFTKVIFNNKSEKKGIIIPNSAIISKFMIPGVYVLDEGIVIFKNIKILKQNDFYSEVNGINLGEIIIIDGKENIWDGEKLK